MKPLLLFFFMLCSITATFSQDFGLNNTVWVYDFNIYYSNQNGVSEIFHIGDTVVGNREVRILTNRLHWNNGGTISIFEVDPIYNTDTDTLIEASRDLINFDTLYDWSHPLGRLGAFTGEMNKERS